MAVTAKWYLNGVKHTVTDTIWTSDTIKVSLHSSAYTPDQDAHEFFSSATNELSTANGYTAGGATLASKTVTVDTTSNETRFDAADVSWTAGSGQTLTARYAVIRKDTGSAATSPVLGYVDFGADVSATNAALTIQWDSTGVLKITAA